MYGSDTLFTQYNKNVLSGVYYRCMEKYRPVMFFLWVRGQKVPGQNVSGTYRVDITYRLQNVSDTKCIRYKTNWLHKISATKHIYRLRISVLSRKDGQNATAVMTICSHIFTNKFRHAIWSSKKGAVSQGVHTV
jgi:hypothetical protein